MTIPDPIHAYFTADTALDKAGVMAAFAADARVLDEAETHVGRAAIGVWWEAAKAKYRHKADPLEAERQPDGTVRVRARVTGDFPGSPATLTYRFRLGAAGITALSIG